MISWSTTLLTLDFTPHVPNAEANVQLPQSTQSRSEAMGLEALLPDYEKEDSVDISINAPNLRDTAVFEVKRYIAAKGCEMMKSPLLW